jgi:hypothetical protein
MLARDQIRAIARELDRTADARMREDDRIEGGPLWEVVRRASRAIEAVAEMERDDVSVEDRSKRARYLISELETALEAARQVKTALEWTPRFPDDEV